MKQLIVAGFLVLLLSACEKKEEDQKNFTAGSLGNSKAYSLNYTDTIPDNVNSGLHDFEWMSTQIIVDADNDLQLRVGHSWGTNNGELYQKAFRIGNNSSSLEFAVNEKDTIIGQNGTLTFVRSYNFGELISENKRWIEGDFEHLFYLSLYFKNDANEYSINRNLTDKYIGIRKLKNGKMMYGWIKIDITNNDILVLKESCFTN